MILSVGYLWAAQLIHLDFWSESEVFNARSMPNLFGTAGVVTSVLLLIVPSPKFDWQALKSLHFVPAICLFVVLGIYGYSIEFVGFVPATIGVLFAGFIILGERRIVLIAIVAMSVCLGFYFLMDLLGIYFSPGEFWMQDD